MAGESVAKLHRRLGLLGIEVPAEERDDDFFGPGTEAAIRQFQNANGLPVLGTVDDATARGLGLGGYPRSITGMVCQPDGTPVPDVAVRLHQQGPGGDRVVAETRSGPEGTYSLPWPHGVSGGLTVRADGGGEKSLSWKSVHASGTAWVRLSVGGEYRGVPRFAVLSSALAPALDDKAVHAIGGDGRAHAIKAIAEAVAVPQHEASRHVLAHKLAARTRLDPSVFFALLAHRVAPDPTVGDAQALDDAHVDHTFDAILRLPADDMRSALKDAVRDNVVASFDIDSAAGELHALQIDHLAAQPLTWSMPQAISDEHDCCADPAEPIRSDDADPDDPAHAAARPVQPGGAPLRDILATSVPEPAIQRQVVEALVTHDRTAKLGAVADVAKSLSPERRAHLRFTLEAAALLGNHLPLVKRVQKLHDSGAIRRSADLARLDEADWASLLHEEDPGAEHIALPARSKLAAAPAGERIEHVARVLARRLERSHPTVALTGRLAKDRGELPLVQAKGVQRFLESEPSLCVRHTHIDRFVHEAASAAPVDDDHAQVIADLKTLQRGYKLTSRFDHVKAMLAAGHTSAHSISSIGPERFAAQMTEAGATPDEASAMFAAAQQVHATTMTLLGNFHSAFTAATPAAVGQPDPAAAIQALASLPTVQALFGSTDYCSCAECRAIHGPAAYLVDILQFLKSRAATGGPANASQAVLNRRPDIAQIQLSCGNTNGIVPYIDLVCETLEDAMGTVPAAAELLRVTSGTEAEVRANPAYVRDTAYAVLKRALYPVAASFDLYGAEVRAFLGQLGIRRHELMAAWQASGAPSDNDIAADRFGLNANALSIITTASPLQPWTLWNLGSDNSASVTGVTFVAASPAVSTRTTSITLNTPGGTQVGDTLLAFFWSGESNDSSLNTGALPAGWSTVATLNTGPRQPAYLVRRTAVASEPTSHAFTSVATGSGRALVGVMLAYRGLDITAPLVASNVTNIGPGSPTTTFTCPGLGLTTYADLYLGFVGDIAPTPTSTVPTGATKRSETQVSTNGGSHLLAFDIQKNAVVDVASQAVTLSVSTSGVAVAYALAKAHNAVPDPRKLDDLKSGDWLQILAYVPILLDRAKISHRELIQLLETRFINPTAAVKVIEAGTTINAVTNFATCDLSKQSVTGWTSDLITRFNRFIRLWRQLGCTIWDLDKMILAPAVGANLLDSNAIVQLSRVNAVAARLGGPWDELLTLWGDMDRFNYVNVLDSSEPVVPSVYRRRFRNPTVAAVSTLFVDDPSTLTGSLDDVEAFAVISAALDLSTDDIKRIRTATSMSTALNLANLSTIARHAMLADRLGLSIAELLTAIAISGVNPFANPLGTLNFLAAFDQMTASGFTIKELDYLLRHGSVIDSGIGLTDATITSWLEDLRRSLVRATSLTPAQAADLVVQRISAMLPLDQTVTQRMLQITLPGGASNIATLFTNPDLTLRNTDGSFNKLTVRANFGTIYDAYIALNKMRIVLGRWQVSTADTLWLLQNAATPSWLQLHTLPVSTSATPVTLVALNTLRQSVDIQQTLATPAGIRLFDIVLAPGATVADAAGQVAQLGGWATADITAIATRFGMTTAASLVAGANAARIRDFMAWARKLGADVPGTISLVAGSVGTAEARKARQLAKSKFTNDQWLGVAGSVQDRLREQKRAALLAWLLVNPNPTRNQTWITVEDLYGFLLIDPEMSATATTTRIKQATASIQLFVQRAQLQLEANVSVSVADDSHWKEWDWMKRFRLWQANRKIFLYPENWFDPAQRRDRSSYFADLVNELQQTDLTNDVAEDALRAYLHKLSDVSHLEVSGIWEEPVAGTSSTILHVVARTRKTPFVYSYRRREITGSWSPWEALDVGADAQHVMPAVWNQRLFMLWTEFTEKAFNPVAADRTVPAAGSNKEFPEPSKYWEIALAWVERRNNIWLPKRLSQRKQLILTTPKKEVVFKLSTPGTSATRNLVVDLYEPIVFSTVGGQTPARWTLTSAQDEPTLLHAARGSFSQLEDVKYIAPMPPGGPANIPFRPNYNGSPISWTFNAYGGDNPGSSAALDLQRMDDPGNLKTILGTIAQPRVITTRFAEKEQFSGSPFFVSDPKRTFFVQFAANKWTLQTFYHPFVETFVQRLNIGSIPGLYDVNIQIDPDTVRGTGAFVFNTTYMPDTTNVQTPYPTETLDYTPTGPYSIYNWELFFHIPLLIAMRLADNQRFDEALRWFHYIFNPTNVGPGTDAQRFWNPKVFRDLQDADYAAQRIEQLLALVNKNDSAANARVAEWRANPFDPNLVAAARPVAYQKAVVMQYVAALIAWGDQLFRGDTIESINEATQLYLLASQLLGPRPQNLRAIQPVQNKTYNDLSSSLDAFSNSLADIENVVSVPPPGVTTAAGSPLHTFYFCIPPNDQMLSYWDTVADRLFKVRHGLNLQGVARPLALYEAPIDPGLLARAAAAGVDISAAIGDAAVEQMCYRFNTLWGVAHDLCQDVRGLGSAILSALERRDGEEMARLRATQEVAVLEAMRQVKANHLDEATANRTAIQTSRDMAVARRDYYGSREFMNAAELQGLALVQQALDFETSAITHDNLAAFYSLLPTFSIGISGFGGTPNFTAAFGSENFIRNVQSAASALRGLAGKKSQKAGLSNTTASYQRRADEWEFQRQLAEKEIAQFDKQLIAADLRIAITQQELNVHLQQTAHAKTNSELLESKFTNKELYDWTLSQLTSTYFHAYQLAYDLAKRAAKAFVYELGVPDPNFIQFGYWDSLHKGLVAGDRLLLDLRRLQADHLSRNTRLLEMTKHVSLLKLDPTQLVALRKSGSCTFSLPEALFDFDQLGHFYRRIKSVSVTLPCVTGPYTTINATLTLLKHSTRVNPVLNPNYKSATFEDQLPTDSRFNFVTTAQQSIALSTGREDAGMFEVNFHDDRYLPFEGLGAVSRWQLDLPKETNQFDRSTLSDVVLHLRYTARFDGALGAKARDEIVTPLPRTQLCQLLSARTEFPDAFARLFAPTGSGQALDLPLTDQHFSFVPTTQKIVINKIKGILLFASDKTYTDYPGGGTKLPLKTHLGVTTGDGTPPTTTANFVADSAFGGVPVAPLDLGTAVPIGSMTFAFVEADVQATVLDLPETVGGTTHHRLDRSKIDDILLFVEYSIVAA